MHCSSYVLLMLLEKKISSFFRAKCVLFGAVIKYLFFLDTMSCMPGNDYKLKKKKKKVKKIFSPDDWSVSTMGESGSDIVNNFVYYYTIYWYCNIPVSSLFFPVLTGH